MFVTTQTGELINLDNVTKLDINERAGAHTLDAHFNRDSAMLYHGAPERCAAALELIRAGLVKEYVIIDLERI